MPNLVNDAVNVAIWKGANQDKINPFVNIEETIKDSESVCNTSRSYYWVNCTVICSTTMKRSQPEGKDHILKHTSSEATLLIARVTLYSETEILLQHFKEHKHLLTNDCIISFTDSLEKHLSIMACLKEVIVY